MASLFRPPEPTRSNPKAPKLKLPFLQNPISSTEGTIPSINMYNSNKINEQVQNRGLSLSLNTGNISGTPSNFGLPSSQYSKSPGSSGPLSARTPVHSSSTRRRPVPPPLPDLSVNSSPSNIIPPSSMATGEIEKSLTSLSINTNSTDLIDKQSGIPRDTDTPCSQDSYLSNLLSTYEQSTSSATSPLKSSNNLSSEKDTFSSDILGKDVNELEEEMWHYKHLKNEITALGMLGEGAGGSVAKCKLKHGSTIFALKTINVLNTDPEFQKQIFRELQFNKSFNSDYIVRYYGMFTDEENTSIYIAMEFMGGKSLEAVYKNLLKRGGRISEKVLGKISESVLRGLSYLHEKKIIHRDIKPQNILLNNKGEVKLCDFGVSGEAVNSLATTFTGTSFYMAPERIQGQPYSVTCDVWSLGLTILEVAQGHFPFGSDKITANIAPIELLVLILTFEPELKDEEENNIKWSGSFKSFIAYSLKKDPRERPSPRQMIKHPWIQGQMKKKVNMETFIQRCWENETNSKSIDHNV